VGTLRAEVPLQARVWVDEIHRHLLVDDARWRKTDFVTRGLTRARGDGGGAGEPERSPLDRVVAADPAAPSKQVLEAFLERLLEEVDRHLEETVRSPVKRLGDLKRAEAAVESLVYERSADEIREVLDPGASRELVYKWVERGRAILLAGVDRCIALAEEPEEKDGLEALRAIIETRRKDAGKPRPTRRKRAAGAAAVSVRARDTSQDQQAPDRGSGAGAIREARDEDDRHE